MDFFGTLPKEAISHTFLLQFGAEMAENIE